MSNLIVSVTGMLRGSQCIHIHGSWMRIKRVIGLPVQTIPTQMLMYKLFASSP